MSSSIIRLPQGFEFRDAEMASGSYRGRGAIAFEHDNGYAYLTHVAYGPFGVVG